MSTKRASEESPHPDTKKVKQETKDETDSVNFKYYDPSSIIGDSDKPEEMTGGRNIELATMFYHARYTDEGQKKEGSFYNRNAGAVQLYEKDDEGSAYPMSGYKYNCESFANRYFEECTRAENRKIKRSSYGHSERILMKCALDDLMKAYGDDGYPSDPNNFPENFKSLGEYEKTYEILKRLTAKASQYKEYLKKKKIIIKMWSERPACKEPPPSGIGEDCEKFTRGICPEGSQFGYIIKYYTREDNKDGEKVIKASEQFRDAYLKYKKSMDLKESCS